MKKDLRYFITQYKVKKLYRDFMKTIYQLKNLEARNELVGYVKSQFILNKEEENMEKKEYLISVGRQQIDYVQSMIDMQQ